MAEIININPVAQHPRLFSDIIDPLEDLDDKRLIIRFRLNSSCIWDLTDMIDDYIAPQENARGRPVPSHVQVCGALRYLASNDFQIGIADSLGISQATMSRSVHNVINAFSLKIGDFVKFPTNADDIERNKRQFYNVARFPGVMGCIDCTHIRILAPSNEEFAYVNRKGYHSLNVQMVCDCDGKFTNICARWPGSSHDAWILRQSQLWEDTKTASSKELCWGTVDTHVENGF